MPVTLGMDFIEGHLGTRETLIERLDAFTAAGNGIGPKAVYWTTQWGGDHRGQWPADFPTEVLTDFAARGIVGIINFTPDGLGRDNICQRIADGEFDIYLTQYAEAARAFGKKVILRPPWEMNGNWFFWSPGIAGNTTASYIAAWRHMYLLMKTIAPNIEFFWCAASSNYTDLALCYPGDNYVQYTGIDLYKMPNNTGTFLTIADKWLPKVQAVGNKPIILGEVGVSNVFDYDTRRAFIRGPEGYTDVVNKYPKVKCIVYFNIDATAVNEPDGRDWRLDTAPSIQYPYKQQSAMPAFQGTLSGWTIKA
jgi:hypothetical protein